MRPRAYKRPIGFPNIEAFLHPSVILPESSDVWWYARVMGGVKIGEHVSIGGGTEVGRDSVIGDYSRIGANVFLPPNTTIGRNVFIGPGVVCTDDSTPFVHLPTDPGYVAQPPVFEDYCSIGAAAVILPGVRVGRYAFVAAGAIVTRDVPPHAAVRCEPARTFDMSRLSRTSLAARDAGLMIADEVEPV